MVKVLTEDGAVFEAENFEDLVQAMKLDMHVPPATSKRYMKDVAKRSRVWDGSKIKYRGARDFIQELERIGVLQILQEN